MEQLHEAHCAFYNKAVCADGYKDVIHLRQGLHDALTFDSPRHVKEDEVKFNLCFIQHCLCVVKRIDSIASRYAEGLLAQLFEMLTGLRLEIVAAFDEFQFLVSQVCKVVLWLVTIYDRHIEALDIVKVVGYKSRDGGLSYSAFLCCERNKSCITHIVNFLNC